MPHINIWLESCANRRFCLTLRVSLAVRLRGEVATGKRRIAEKFKTKLTVGFMFDLLQTTRSPNLFEISPRPFAVTTSPLQNRGQFGSFGQRQSGFGFLQNFPSQQQQQSAQRQNPYLDTTGFGEVMIALTSLRFACAPTIGTVLCQSTAECTNNFLGNSLQLNGKKQEGAR